jgi:hypothetical protein
LGLGNQLLENFQTVLVVPTLVRHHIVKTDPAMFSNPTEGDLRLLEEPDQVRSGDIKELSGLLGCELGVHRQQGDTVPLGHFRQYVLQETNCGQGQGDGCGELAILLEAKPRIRLIQLQKTS